ncbi:hypothetical protein Q5530_33550 [Saccharothrix sp. BKS2]|uniref:hypothetical protein n=1 Tax=Saccharothrix sp. BKS2 TaxID=3064400 RepID=UPI0039E91CED
MAIDSCLKGLETATNQASAWTGEASNACTERINRMKQALGEMRKPAHDVGPALVDIADGFEFKASTCGTTPESPSGSRSGSPVSSWTSSSV